MAISILNYRYIVSEQSNRGFWTNRANNLCGKTENILVLVNSFLEES